MAESEESRIGEREGKKWKIRRELRAGPSPRRNTKTEVKGRDARGKRRKAKGKRQDGGKRPEANLAGLVQIWPAGRFASRLHKRQWSEEETVFGGAGKRGAPPKLVHLRAAGAHLRPTIGPLCSRRPGHCWGAARWALWQAFGAASGVLRTSQRQRPAAEERRLQVAGDWELGSGRLAETACGRATFSRVPSLALVLRQFSARVPVLRARKRPTFGPLLSAHCLRHTVFRTLFSAHTCWHTVASRVLLTVRPPETVPRDHLGPLGSSRQKRQDKQGPTTSSNTLAQPTLKHTYTRAPLWPLKGQRRAGAPARRTVVNFVRLEILSRPRAENRHQHSRAQAAPSGALSRPPAAD